MNSLLWKQGGVCVCVCGEGGGDLTREVKYITVSVLRAG